MHSYRPANHKINEIFLNGRINILYISLDDPNGSTCKTKRNHQIMFSVNLISMKSLLQSNHRNSRWYTDAILNGSNFLLVFIDGISMYDRFVVIPTFSNFTTHLYEGDIHDLRYCCIYGFVFYLHIPSSKWHVSWS